MKIIKWKYNDKFIPIDEDIVIAIGNFDGVHKGHCKLLEIAKDKAIETNLSFGVVTFDPHPRDFFSSKKSSFKLLDTDEKEYQLKNLGADYLIIIDFNEELKNCSSNEFLFDILYKTFRVKKMFAGSNFKFGKNREGTIAGSKQYANKIGLEIVGVDLAQIKSQDKNELKIISSQAIRSFIRDGKLNVAANLLGRNWCVTGTVIKGKQQGRELGFLQQMLTCITF